MDHFVHFIFKVEGARQNWGRGPRPPLAHPLPGSVHATPGDTARRSNPTLATSSHPWHHNTKSSIVLAGKCHRLDQRSTNFLMQHSTVFTDAPSQLFKSHFSEVSVPGSKNLRTFTVLIYENQRHDNCISKGCPASTDLYTSECLCLHVVVVYMLITLWVCFINQSAALNLAWSSE